MQLDLIDRLLLDFLLFTFVNHTVNAHPLLPMIAFVCTKAHLVIIYINYENNKRVSKTIIIDSRFSNCLDYMNTLFYLFLYFVCMSVLFF